MKFNKDSKIYVAGHNGMVGSAIIRKLKSLGFNNPVTATKEELDLRRQADTEDFFDQHKPELVFLNAAKVGGIAANDKFKAEFIYDNIIIAANVIEASYKFGVRKLLNLGSSCIYPKFAPQPMKEEYLLTGTLEPSNEPYAIAKIAAIKLCTSYNYQYGTDFISLMPSNLFGVGDSYNLATSHVLPALMRKMILAKLLNDGNYEAIRKDLRNNTLGFGVLTNIDNNSDEEIDKSLMGVGVTKYYVKIWGKGKVKREFLLVDDLADACVYFMENHDSGVIKDFVNIGTGVDISISGLAEIIKRQTGFQGELLFDMNKPEGVARKLLDVSKAKQLGWTASVELEDGIRMVVKEYYANLLDK